MKRLFVISTILLCVFAACSPQKRVARIVKKYNLPTVTEYVSDTVFVPERVRTDTVIMRGDPVVINDTAFITELVPVNDTTYIVRTTIKADTIIKRVPVQKYVLQDKVKNSVGLEILKTVVFFIFALGLFVFALILYRLWGK